MNCPKIATNTIGFPAPCERTRLRAFIVTMIGYGNALVQTFKHAQFETYLILLVEPANDFIVLIAALTR